MSESTATEFTSDVCTARDANVVIDVEQLRLALINHLNVISLHVLGREVDDARFEITIDGEPVEVNVEQLLTTNAGIRGIVLNISGGGWSYTLVECADGYMFYEGEGRRHDLTIHQKVYATTDPDKMLELFSFHPVTVP